jgi:hypothetical protein
MIFSQNGFLGGLPTSLFSLILKPQDHYKTNVPSVFKLTVKSVIFHTLGIMGGVVPVPSRHTCLFHFIGFKGEMDSSIRLYLFKTWALP